MRLRFLFIFSAMVCLLISVGGFSVFKLKQWLIQYDVEALIKYSLSDKSLDTISISAENQHELRWQRVNKEFWYKGQLYDIVRIEQKKNTTLYYCFNDTKETQLVYDFIEKIENEADSSHSEKTSLTDFLKKILKITPPQYAPLDDAVVAIIFYKTDKTPIPFLCSYQSRPRDGLEPPPKLWF